MVVSVADDIITHCLFMHDAVLSIPVVFQFRRNEIKPVHLVPFAEFISKCVCLEQ